MNDLKLIYEYCKKCLESEIKYDIELGVTNAKTYFGKIYFNDNRIPTKIMLSKYNLWVSKWNDEDILETIDTICHEFAHIHVSGHNENHLKLTELYTKLCYLEIDTLKQYLTLEEN